MFSRLKNSLAKLAASSIVICLLSAAVSAQCAMCRASIAGSNNARFMRNLNLGVLVLLAPPVAIFCAVFVALRRTRNETPGVEDKEL